MPKLENDLNNFFDDNEITDPRLDVFIGGSIVTLTEKNIDGVYTQSIADLKVVYDPFHLKLSSLGIDFRIGMGKTELRKDVVEDFKEFVRNNKGTVTSKYFKAHHDFYIEFYYNELEDYNKINKTTAPGMINNYATAAHTHVADFTPAFDAEAADFKLRYSNAVDTQTIAKNNVSEDRTGRDSGRKAVNIILFSVYNFVKSKCFADYDIMHSIFPLETLFRHTPRVITHYTGSEPALATTNVAEKIYDENQWLMYHNLGTTDQLVGLESTALTPVETTYGKLVKAGKTKSFRILSTGKEGCHFLNVTNLNLTDQSSWKMETYNDN